MWGARGNSLTDVDLSLLAFHSKKVVSWYTEETVVSENPGLNACDDLSSYSF